MGIERHLDKTESILEKAFADFTEALWFRNPETVGTIRVMEVFPDRKYYPGFDMVLLEFGFLKETDESPYILRVPRNLLKEGQAAEIIIKRARVETDPVSFLIAIRPFDPKKYGKPIGWGESEISNMFGYNMMDSRHSKVFFNKFVNPKR